MLFVGLASYMGTFPEMMVSTSLASQLLRAWLYAPGLGFLTKRGKSLRFLPTGSQDVTGTSHPIGAPFFGGFNAPPPALIMSLVSRHSGIFLKRLFTVLLVTVPNFRVSSQADEEFLLGTMG